MNKAYSCYIVHKSRNVLIYVLLQKTLQGETHEESR